MLWWCALFLLLPGAVWSVVIVDTDFANLGYRLPISIVPSHYNLLLDPVLDIVNNNAEIFNAKLTITVQVNAQTDQVVLHSNKLNYSLLNLSSESGLVPIRYDIVEDAREYLVITTDTPLLAGEYSLHFEFTGKLNDGIVGFYASSSGRRFTRLLCARQSEVIFSTVEVPATTLSKALPMRLPRSVLPKRYELTLAPDLGVGRFSGNVRIHVNVDEPRSFINLHSNYLKIHKVQFYKSSPAGVTEIPVSKFFLVDDLEYLVVEFGSEVERGIYKLYIEFEGDLTRNIVGFYSSKVGNKVMAASKFQPTYARQAFPCFDEPHMKATYDIKLVKPSMYTALSNMNEISSEVNADSNTDTVKFATSVPMSTYLACFVICDYGFWEETVDTRGIGDSFTLRAYARDTKNIAFALDIGKRATEFYIQYYQVPFPLPKLDMIAIPDYVSGATEHWGLITYRETAFLIDEATASAANKISVANTIAHELAHMWFGNLVTMKWWDEVWLNEGFATYMQVKALNEIEPSWTMLDQFLIKTLHPVLVKDSKLSSHPIVQTVTTPDQITAIFDAISYNKGSSILRMLEGFIGASNFQRGVTDYLNKHKYGNTVTQDLLASLEPYFLQNNPDLNLRYILDTWTKQTGYPLVTVSHGPDTYSFKLTQTRFLADPAARTDDVSPYNYRWYIPITYKTAQGDNSQVLWFPDTAESLDIKVSEESFWIKVNNDETGYYRVNYPQDVWLSLLNQLQMQTNKLTISDRAQLLDDVFELAAARVLSYELALRVSTYLPHERAYAPWAVAADTFTLLHLKLRDTGARSHCLQYIQSLVEPVYRTMSWDQPDNINIIQSLLRMQVLSIASDAGLADAREKSRQLFQQWLNSHSTQHNGQPVVIEPDLRNIIYYNGMRQATADEWERMWQIYKSEEDAQERAKLMRALAAPEDAALLARYLEAAWEESNVRGQDYLTVLGYISSNEAGEALVWDYVRSHWTQLVQRFTLNSRYLGALLPAITAAFHTQQRLHEMEEFFSLYPEGGAGESARRTALETVRNNIQWSQHNEPAVSGWLRDYIASIS